MEGMATTEVQKDYLQQLGREAAARYVSRHETMNNAVISVLDKEAGLTPEHIKRVIEYANNEAYHDEFSNMDGEHRIVNLDGGPASPGEVLRELEMSDSAPALVKSAAHASNLRPFVPGEDEFEGFFDKEKLASEEPMRESRPHGALIDLRGQLQSVKADFLTKISSAEIEYERIAGRMYNLVKQAVLGGTSPAEISIIFQRAAPSPEFTKLALKHIADRMDPEGIPAVVCSQEKIKEASERTLNVHNPIVAAFLDFVKVATDRLTLIRASEDVDAQLKRVNKALYEVMR